MNTETNNIEKMQNNLALIRDIAGWTTRDLAQKIGVSKKTISDLEDNKIAMTAEQYSLIKKELDNCSIVIPYNQLDINIKNKSAS